MAKQIVRPKEAQRRLAIGHTNFHDNFVRTGRVRLVRLGPRSVGVIEEELDALIEEIAAARDREGGAATAEASQLSQRKRVSPAARPPRSLPPNKDPASEAKP